MTDKRVTQAAVEQWVKGPAPSGRVTQAAAEHWASVAFYLPGALHADGHAQVAFTGRLVRQGVARMDGRAQASFTGIRVLPGAARMDGQADVAFSRIAVTVSAAHMNGFAQVGFTGVARTGGAARMDGQASMIAISLVGAGVAHMDGVASMIAVNALAPPQTYYFTMAESIVSAGQVTHISHDMHVQLQHIINIRQPMLASARYKRAYQDHFQLTDNRVVRLVQKLREAIALASVQGTYTNYHYVFTTPIFMQSTLSHAAHAVMSLVENVFTHDTTSQKFIWGRTLKEVLKVSAAANAGGVYKKVLAQLFKLSDIDGFSHTIPIVLNQGIGLSLSLAHRISLKLLQQFLVATASSPVFRYHMALVGRVVVEGILDHFAHAILTQLLTVHPAVNRQFITNNSLAQLLTVSSALTNKLILEIVESSSLVLDSSQLVHMIYQGDPLLDSVAITALFVSPSGTTTTWAVNTRTNAVTEYLNYDFRSFAMMGNRYIAAGSEGLYELDGDTDDGTSIVAEMMSGYLQLNEKKMFGIKGAYIAIRGGGRFYLKLISGDGREYVYELRAQPNLMTTKVKVGKGLKTTYMAFDLVTEGQDFDLDSIEFIPMTSKRRV